MGLQHLDPWAPACQLSPHTHADTRAHGLLGREQQLHRFLKNQEQEAGCRIPRARLGDGTLRTERPRAPHAGRAIPNASWLLNLLPGSEAGALGEVRAPGPHVWASESSSRPPFPSRYLARSFLVTIPTT